MKVFIIGGTGFVGRRLVASLVELGHEVTCMDIKPAPAEFSQFGSKVLFLRGDITKFDDVIAGMAAAKPDRTINLSFYLGSDLSPRQAFNLNVVGMENFLEASRLCDVPHVLYASSLAVNGDQRHYGDRPITEDDKVNPDDQYSQHKAFNEFQAQDYIEKHRMIITGLRPANITGFDKIVGSLEHVTCITAPAAGQAVEFENSLVKWCPIHIDDVTEAFSRLTVADKPKYAIYNTGGTSISMGEIADIVKEIIPKSKITFKNTLDAPTETPNYNICNNRLKNEFNIKFAPFEQRVLQMINEVRSSAI